MKTKIQKTVNIPMDEVLELLIEKYPELAKDNEVITHINWYNDYGNNLHPSGYDSDSLRIEFVDKDTFEENKANSLKYQGEQEENKARIQRIEEALLTKGTLTLEPSS